MHDYHPRLVDPSFNATPVSVMKEHNVNDSSTRMNNPQPTHSCSQGHWEQQDRFLDTSVSPEPASTESPHINTQNTCYHYDSNCYSDKTLNEGLSVTS